MRAGLLIALLISIALAACGFFYDDVKGSGYLVTQNMPISDFTKVETGNSFKVSIIQADSFNVAVRVDDNLVEHLDVRKSEETLVIRLKSGVSARAATLQAEVSLPELTGVKLTGASRAVVGGFTSQGNFSAELSGASFLSGNVQALQTDVDLSGASVVVLAGKGTTLTLGASGASNADLEEFTVDSAKVELSGASTARLNVKDNIGPVSLSGASRLIYSGDPAFRDFQPCISAGE